MQGAAVDERGHLFGIGTSVLIVDVTRNDVAARCTARRLGRSREAAGVAVVVVRVEVAWRRYLVHDFQLVSMVVAELELLQARAERMLQRSRIVVAEIVELLLDDLSERRAFVDRLARDAAELVVRPVRFDVMKWSVDGRR